MPHHLEESLKNNVVLLDAIPPHGCEMNLVDTYPKSGYETPAWGKDVQLRFCFDGSTVSSTDKSRDARDVRPFRRQLLKWVGNKQRFAHDIISFFPCRFRVYYEPFVGSGAVLGSLRPSKAIAGDVFEPLIALWNTLKDEPDVLKGWYKERWNLSRSLGKSQAYSFIRDNYNRKANPADLLYLSRACYGGVVRFRKADGYMSTPCGVHEPITPMSFAVRVDDWSKRVRGTSFIHSDYEEVLDRAGEDDIVYCDPPYSFSQAILYGAQEFNLTRLVQSIEKAKARGAFIALSIDGSKKSGLSICKTEFPAGIFQREVAVNIGRSMLRRFQMGGQTLEEEVVTDRLLLTH